MQAVIDPMAGGETQCWEVQAAVYVSMADWKKSRCKRCESRMGYKQTCLKLERVDARIWKRNVTIKYS
jgi:hypothetical protein